MVVGMGKKTEAELMKELQGKVLLLAQDYSVVVAASVFGRLSAVISASCGVTREKHAETAGKCFDLVVGDERDAGQLN